MGSSSLLSADLFNCFAAVKFKKRILLTVRYEMYPFLLRSGEFLEATLSQTKAAQTVRIF